MLQSLEELRLTLESSNYSDEIKEKILENSKEMFLLNNFLKDKYPNTSQDFIENKTDVYIKSRIESRLTESSDEKHVMDEIINLSVDFAREEGYENIDSLRVSLTNMINLHNEQRNENN
tara:strand:- start:18302 stop:18658 length:357 start_codon:yes stop_codon:yes gene_type:complete